MVHAIEGAIPEYDAVNEKVSLGRAQWARRHLVERLQVKEEALVLDLGIGPGTMSEVLLRETPTPYLVGLDASRKLLDAASDRLRQFSSRTGFVRGIFEAQPFKDACFDRIVSAYAFRDAIDRDTAIRETARVTSEGGVFGIVDFGKPDSVIKRLFVTMYVKYFLVMISRFSKSKRILGNPWVMIYPTYKLLGKNKDVAEALGKWFSHVQLLEFSLGGLVLILSNQAVRTHETA